MVRRVHHHHGASGCIGPCDCPNPLAPEPVLGSEAIWGCGRPPPTGYRDEREVFHPGPGSRGYVGHLAAGCWPCFGSLARAREAGEPWALAVEVPATTAYDVPALIARTEDAIERAEAWHRSIALRLRPQRIGPAAVVVGAASYAITALLAWWVSAPLLVGLLSLLVCVGRADLVQVDRTPTARLLRR